MELLAIIADRSIFLFGVMLFALQTGSYVLGLRMGRRHRRRGDAVESVGVVVSGMLALLAFVLALTLSFANARYNERQAGSLSEASSLATAWLRAKAVGGPDGEAIAGLLQDYTRVRTEYVRAARDDSIISGFNQQTAALQSAIWTRLIKIVHERTDPVADSLMVSLNNAFDAGTAERFAFDFRLPEQMFWLLMTLTMVSMACLGFQLGLSGEPPRILVALLILVWTSVIVNILDLASGRLGNLRAVTAPYEWTLRGFDTGLSGAAAGKP